MMVQKSWGGGGRNIIWFGNRLLWNTTFWNIIELEKHFERTRGFILCPYSWYNIIFAAARFFNFFPFWFLIRANIILFVELCKYSRSAENTTTVLSQIAIGDFDRGQRLYYVNYMNHDNIFMFTTVYIVHKRVHQYILLIIINHHLSSIRDRPYLYNTHRALISEYFKTVKALPRYRRIGCGFLRLNGPFYSLDWSHWV